MRYSLTFQACGQYHLGRSQSLFPGNEISHSGVVLVTSGFCVGLSHGPWPLFYQRLKVPKPRETYISRSCVSPFSYLIKVCETVKIPFPREWGGRAGIPRCQLSRTMWSHQDKPDKKKTEFKNQGKKPNVSDSGRETQSLDHKVEGSPWCWWPAVPALGWPGVSWHRGMQTGNCTYSLAGTLYYWFEASLQRQSTFCFFSVRASHEPEK